MKYDKYKDEIIYWDVICISVEELLIKYEQPEQEIRIPDYTNIAN